MAFDLLLDMLYVIPSCSFEYWHTQRIQSISLSPRESYVCNNRDRISSIPIDQVYCVDSFE